MNSTVEEILKKAMASLLPPPKLTISEWADKNRMLSAESASEPGRWRTSRTEYMREILDCVLDPKVSRVTIMASSQIGKTELLLNIIGYFVEHDPSPMILLQPTEAMAKVFSKDRLSPMIRDTKSLTNLFTKSKSRDSSNTILQKSFLGGSLAIIGSNSPSQLASRPIRIVLADEIDRYAVTSEGGALDLVKRRTATFNNRKIITVSTPNLVGESEIHAEYESGSRGVYEIPCLNCSEYFEQQWDLMAWDKDEEGNHLPATSGMICPHCGTKNEQKYKANQVLNGRWNHRTENKSHRSFHVGSWVSPFVSYQEITEDFLKAKSRGGDEMRVHVNTFQGLPYENHKAKIDANELQKRQRKYTDEDHEAYDIVTVGVDVQGNRVELEVVGYNRLFQSWNLGYEVVHGDPNSETLWNDLDSRLAKYKFHALAIDSGGHHTKQVYLWVYRNQGKRYYAIKGRGGEGIPTTSPPTYKSIGRNRKVPLYILGTNQIKSIVTQSFLVENPQDNGYCNFPEELDTEYFLQLLSERRVVTKAVRGTPKVEWIKSRRRNEAFDARCYSYAALEILNVNWDFIEETKQMNAPKNKKKTLKTKKGYNSSLASLRRRARREARNGN